jgi:hypothetical protein
MEVATVSEYSAATASIGGVVRLLSLSSVGRYLYADMGVVLGFVVLVPTLAPRSYIQRGRPETNLVSPTILRSVMGQTFLVILFQVSSVMMGRWWG